jgi:hypothetical protein
MSTNTQLSDRQGMILEWAQSVGWCANQKILLRGSISVATENQWRTALEFATATELEILTEHIRAAEIQQDRDREWQQDFDQARERRESGPTEGERADFNQLRIEAAVAAQEAARPATRAQLATLIDLQRDILAALTKR